jgi:hypothetical protein
MSWAMLSTARIAHLLGCAESDGVEAVIGAVPSAVCTDRKWRDILLMEIISPLTP